MKYTTLKTDIISILHSSDYDFELKFYDKDGNTTLNPEEVQWAYIKNKNIMLEFPTDENSVLCFWKETDLEEPLLAKIIQRIRELSILNGVSVQIRNYDDLNRRKIYNIIKNAITTSKEEEMSESVNKKLSKALYELSNTIRNTKRSSDHYISESLSAKNIKGLMNDAITCICGIDSLNNNQVKSLLNKTLIESSYKTISKLVDLFETKCSDSFNSLVENINNIENTGSFIKQRYLSNLEVKKNPHTMLVLENIIVYPVKTKLDKENLVKAYNHLISVCEGAKTGTDILRMIKKHNLCETYKVSKDDLLDMWLSKSIDEKIEPKTLLVFENVNGNKITFNTEMKPSVKLLAEHFNNNGTSDDKITQTIVDETIRLNSLTDLVENYSYNTSIKHYGKVLKQLYKECLDKLSKEIVTPNEPMFDYSKELSLLEGKVGFKHPGLKYIAMYEAKINDENNIHMTVERIKDEKILREGLSLTVPFNKTKSIARSIINGNLLTVKSLKESKEDKLSLAKSMLDNVYSVDTDVKDSLNECLFMIVSHPSKYNKDRQTFVKTIKKYVK